MFHIPALMTRSGISLSQFLAGIEVCHLFFVSVFCNVGIRTGLPWSVMRPVSLNPTFHKCLFNFHYFFSLSFFWKSPWLFKRLFLKCPSLFDLVPLFMASKTRFPGIQLRLLLYIVEKLSKNDSRKNVIFSKTSAESQIKKLLSFGSTFNRNYCLFNWGFYV